MCPMSLCVKGKNVFVKAVKNRLKNMENKVQNIGNQEITLRGVILFLIKYAKIVRRRWYIVALSCLLFSSYNLYNAFKAKWKYNANLTFMLNDAIWIGRRRRRRKFR
jgi:hypothetical protein